MYDSENKLLCKLEADEAELRSCGIEDGHRIHVSLCQCSVGTVATGNPIMQVVNKDPTKKKGDFEDVSKVEKYEISDEAYSKRAGNGTGRFFPMLF